MSITTIRAVLETRLAEWAAAQSPPISVGFQDAAFNKPTNPADHPAPFLEAFLIPNTTINLELSGSRATMLGMFQVNIWTVRGHGMRGAETIAEGLISLYPLVPKFSAVSIESTPSVGHPLPEASGWVVTPVLIKYRYEAVVV